MGVNLAAVPRMTYWPTLARLFVCTAICVVLGELIGAATIPLGGNYRITLLPVLWALLIGAAWGAVFGLVGHAATRGRRDFSSARTLTATRYDIVARGGTAEQSGPLEDEDGAGRGPRLDQIERVAGRGAVHLGREQGDRAAGQAAWGEVEPVSRRRRGWRTADEVARLDCAENHGAIGEDESERWLGHGGYLPV